MTIYEYLIFTLMYNHVAFIYLCMYIILHVIVSRVDLGLDTFAPRSCSFSSVGLGGGGEDQQAKRRLLS